VELALGDDFERTEGATKADGLWTPNEIANQIGTILG